MEIPCWSTTLRVPSGSIHTYADGLFTLPINTHKLPINTQRRHFMGDLCSHREPSIQPAHMAHRFGIVGNGSEMNSKHVDTYTLSRYHRERDRSNVPCL